MLVNDGATRLLVADANEARIYDITKLSRTQPSALNIRCRFLPFDKASITCASQCLDLHVRLLFFAIIDFVLKFNFVVCRVQILAAVCTGLGLWFDLDVH